MFRITNLKKETIVVESKEIKAGESIFVNSINTSLLEEYNKGVLNIDHSEMDIDNSPTRFDEIYNSQITAYSRLKSATPNLVWEEKFLYSEEYHSHEYRSNGTGSGYSYDPDKSAVVLESGTGSTAWSLQQTKKHFPSLPGQESGLIMGFGLRISQDSDAENSVREVGFHNGDDGIFLRHDANNGLQIIIKSSITGSISETVISRDQWNIDKFDGLGTSQYEFDLASVQAMTIDFEWSNRIVVGFIIAGIPRLAHRVSFPEVNNLSHLNTPNLPIRAEVRNTDANDNPQNLDVYFSTLIVDGDVYPTTHDYALPNEVEQVSVGGNTARVPILAIRQDPTFNGKVNRRIAALSTYSIYSSDSPIFYEVVQFPEPSADINWQNVDDNHTTMQYAHNSQINSIDAASEHPIARSFLAAAKNSGGSPAEGSVNTSLNTHHYEMLTDFEGNGGEMIVIYATNLTSTDTLVSAAAETHEYH